MIQEMNEFEYLVYRVTGVSEMHNPKDFIKKHGLNTKSRVRDMVILRQELMFRIRNRTKLSLESVGKLFNRKHCGVIHSVNTVKDMRKYNDQMYNEIIEKYRDELNELDYNLL